MWLVVDNDGEFLFTQKPSRKEIGGHKYWSVADYNKDGLKDMSNCYFKLAEGEIENHLDRKITWENEPVEI